MAENEKYILKSGEYYFYLPEPGDETYCWSEDIDEATELDKEEAVLYGRLMKKRYPNSRITVCTTIELDQLDDGDKPESVTIRR